MYLNRYNFELQEKGRVVLIQLKTIQSHDTIKNLRPNRGGGFYIPN